MRSDHTSLLDQFDRELEAAYRSEVYRVRDNGAVCRQRRPGSRKRPLDDLWTFGVPNASTGYMGNPEPLEFYLPPARSVAPDSGLMVRVSGSPRDVVGRLQDAARDLDARLQPTVQMLTEAYEREMQKAAAALAVIAMLGTVANLLSVIGLAGLAGYTVAQRTREIGLRIALGARPTHVVRAVLAPMGRPIVIGFVCGAFAGSAVASILRSGIPTMSGVNVYDPVPYVMAMSFFAAVVALAILAPGRRAIRVNPMHALRHE